jgi:hypothetical protein
MCETCRGNLKTFVTIEYISNFTVNLERRRKESGMSRYWVHVKAAENSRSISSPISK